MYPYPLGRVGGQRFRFEQYIDVLTERGVAVDFYPFYTPATYRILYQQGKQVAKMRGVLGSMLRRLGLLCCIFRYDYVFLYREALPFGLPVWEWIVCKLLRKRLIIDFDDAIWLPPQYSRHGRLSWLRYPAKLGYICRWAYAASCGNNFLAAYALQQGAQRVVLMPTTLDLNQHHNQLKQHQLASLPHEQRPIIIGWTGTHTTLPYLEQFYPIAERLAQHYNIQLQVIANAAPATQLPFVRYIAWNAATEISDLLHFDIGIMPLNDTVWEQGKCGFKALQYMALGIPTVASGVGVNGDIIQHQHNGLIANTADEWYHCIAQLIEQPQLRQQLGRQGHQTVAERYSKQSQQDTFWSLFE